MDDEEQLSDTGSAEALSDEDDNLVTEYTEQSRHADPYNPYQLARRHLQGQKRQSITYSHHAVPSEDYPSSHASDRPSGLLGLPVEVLTSIVTETGHDNTGDLFVLQQVCRTLRYVMRQDVIWCQVMDIPMGNDVGQAGKRAREAAARQYNFICVACNHYERYPHRAIVNNGRYYSFCRKCYLRGIDMHRWERTLRDHSVAYWSYAAAQRHPPENYDPVEIMQDAWQRQISLWMVDKRLFGLSGEEIWAPDLPEFVTDELMDLCRQYVFHCGEVQIPLDEVAKAARLIDKRYKQYTAWQISHAAVLARLERELTAHMIWQRHAKVEKLKGFLDLKSIGLHLARREVQLLGREIGRLSKPGLSAYAYTVHPIVLLHHDESIPLKDQLDKVPVWIAETVEYADDELSCLRMHCSTSATPGCRSCLCPTHCTQTDRSYLRVRGKCKAHPMVMSLNKYTNPELDPRNRETPSTSMH